MKAKSNTLINDTKGCGIVELSGQYLYLIHIHFLYIRCRLEASTPPLALVPLARVLLLSQTDPSTTSTPRRMCVKPRRPLAALAHF